MRRIIYIETNDVDVKTDVDVKNAVDGRKEKERGERQGEEEGRREHMGGFISVDAQGGVDYHSYSG